jgi:hypothetical protein
MEAKNKVVLSMLEYLIEELEDCRRTIEYEDGDLKPSWVDKIMKCYTIISE